MNTEEVKEDVTTYGINRIGRWAALQNPHCDNDKCLSPSGEVRVLPTGGDGNAILCLACFNHEITFRRHRNLNLSADCQFDLPQWTTLKVYEVNV